MKNLNFRQKIQFWLYHKVKPKEIKYTTPMECLISVKTVVRDFYKGNLYCFLSDVDYKIAIYKKEKYITSFNISEILVLFSTNPQRFCDRIISKIERHLEWKV